MRRNAEAVPTFGQVGSEYKGVWVEVHAGVSGLTGAGSPVVQAGVRTMLVVERDPSFDACL